MKWDSINEPGNVIVGKYLREFLNGKVGIELVEDYTYIPEGETEPMTVERGEILKINKDWLIELEES